MQVQISINQAQYAALQRELGDAKNKIARAQATAVNRTLKSTTVYVSREIRADLNIKAGELKRRNLVIAKKATPLQPGAHLVITGSRIPLIHFGARQGKKGTAYRIRKSGKRERVADAFVATMRSGHTGIFRRIGKKRLPITELFGPSVPHVAQNLPALSQSALNAKVGATLEKELNHQIKYYLTKD